MITNRIINRLLLLIRVPIECRGTMPSYCAHVATPKDAHAHGARARARMRMRARMRARSGVGSGGPACPAGQKSLPNEVLGHFRIDCRT